MKAVAVIPGQVNSIHLAELPKPSVHDIPDGRGVLVQVLRVGVDRQGFNTFDADLHQARNRVIAAAATAHHADARLVGTQHRLKLLIFVSRCALRIFFDGQQGLFPFSKNSESPAIRSIEETGIFRHSLRSEPRQNDGRVCALGNVPNLEADFFI